MPQPKASDIGKMFRQTRKQLGWTQEDCAANSELSLGTIKKAETGEPLRPFCHRKLVKAFNKYLPLEKPPQPLVIIPYPCDEGATESPASNSSDIRRTDSPLGNPLEVAVHEVLRHTAPTIAKTKIRLGAIRSPAELKKLWLIDNAAYGDANIAFPHFLKLWGSFPLGLRVLFSENEIMGALGIWPVSSSWAEQFKSARLLEAQLDSDMVHQCAGEPTRHWYVSGIVVREHLAGSRAIKKLLTDGLASWLAQAKIEYPCQILALDCSNRGHPMLERFEFYPIQDATAMPDRCSLYGLDIGSRAALVKLLRKRRLDVK
jgi:hypothetical protein